MMKTITVVVTLKTEVSDPQGLVITNSLHTLGYLDVENVRCGKYIQISVPESFSQAQVEEVCQKVLSNPVIEDYKILND